MKTYEEEVVSIPAGKTIQGVERYGIYACGDDKQHHFKKCLYMTFREPGGTMRVLYKLDACYKAATLGKQIKISNMPFEHEKRIMRFLKDRKVSYFDYATENDVICFYVLDLKHTIKTEAHSARRAGQGVVYYYLADMLDESRQNCLLPASQERSNGQQPTEVTPASRDADASLRSHDSNLLNLLDLAIAKQNKDAESHYAKACALMELLLKQNDADVLKRMIEELRAADQLGNPCARYRIGVVYEQRNKETADSYYQSAKKRLLRWAEDGDAEAALCLGEMYHYGRGVVMNKVKSASWLNKARENGAGKRVCSFLLQCQHEKSEVRLSLLAKVLSREES